MISSPSPAGSPAPCQRTTKRPRKPRRPSRPPARPRRATARRGFPHMADYIIDIWKDGELVQSVAGKWTDDEAPRLTLYYLGYYHAERAQLLRERATGGGASIPPAGGSC